MKLCPDCGHEIAHRRRVCADCKLIRDIEFVRRRIQASIGHSVKRAVVERDGMKCRHCARKVRFSTGGVRDKADEVLTFDHFPVPVSRGGKGTVENVVVACMKCNLSRGDRF